MAEKNPLMFLAREGKMELWWNMPEDSVTSREIILPEPKQAGGREIDNISPH